MLKTVLRDLVAHRARVLMTLIAIALGVAATVATWVAADSSATALAGLSPRTGVGIAVQSAGAPDLSDADLTELGLLPGVSAATGIRVGRAGLVGADGKLVRGSTVLDRAGTGWDGTGRFELVEGSAPRPGEIAIGVDAARAGLRPGDTARVLLSDARADTARISGVYRYHPLGPTDGDVRDPAPTVAYSAADAARAFGTDLLRIELAAAAETGSVRAAVQELVGPGRVVASGAELAAAAEAERADNAADLLALLLPFAAIGLLVGAFIIATTFTMLVTQRTRQFGLLRALGARRGQLRRAVLVEAAVLALVGGTVGVIAGLPLAPALLIMMGGREIAAFTVTPTAVLLGYGVAIGVTLLAASGAARRAAAVTPMAALRMDAAVPRQALRGPAVAGVVLVACGGIGVVLTADPSSADLSRVVALLSVVIVVVGVLLLAPRVTVLIFSPLSRWIDRIGGPVARLAMRNVAREPRRTAGTAAAITIGLALVCAFGTMSASFDALIASTTRANIPLTTSVVQPTAGRQAVLSEADMAIAAAVPGVTSVAASRDEVADITVPSGPTVRMVSAIEPAALGSVLTPRITAGVADLHRGVVVSQNQADMMGLRLGDPITLELAVPVRTSVVGIYDATELAASIFYDVALAPPAVRGALTTIYATGADPAAVHASLVAAFAQRPDVTVTDREGVAEQGIAAQRGAFAILYAMFALAILIAVFGVVNTLALAVRERTREIGLLRAVGATRRLVHRTIQAESIVIALFGAASGVVVGVFGGAVMQHAMLGQRLGDFTVPFGLIGGSLAVIVVAAVGAAAWPARTAARTDVLAAIAGS